MPQELDLSALPVTHPDDPAACTTSLGTRRVYAGAWQAFRA